MSLDTGKILVIRMSSLGDLVLLVPSLLRLRKALPAATVHLLTKRRFAGLFDAFPAIDRLVTIEGGGIAEIASLRRSLAAERYDAIVDAHGVIRSAILLSTIRAPRKARIAKNELGKLLLLALKIGPRGGAISQAERYERLFDSLGIDRLPGHPSLPLPSAARERSSRALASLPAGRAPIAFAPGARWAAKTWPAERYAELAARVTRAGRGAVLLGGSGDAARNAAIASRVSPSPLDLTGKLSILESAAVLERCAALVTNDSAPLHLAEAVGTPVVALYGPTVRAFGYFPRLPASVALEVDLWCRPCSRNGARPCPLRTRKCLMALSVDRAAEALDRVLAAREAEG